MSLHNVIAGLNIFGKYNGTMTAYHDELKAGQPHEDTLTEEEVKTLMENDWHPDWTYAWDVNWDGDDEDAPMDLLRRCDCWYYFT